MFGSFVVQRSVRRVGQCIVLTVNELSRAELMIGEVSEQFALIEHFVHKIFAVFGSNRIKSIAVLALDAFDRIRS